MPSDTTQHSTPSLLPWRRLLPGALPYVLTLPALLVCIGILIPFITAVRYSLQRGLDDYANLLMDAGLWDALLVSLSHAAGAGFVELVLGFGIALLLRLPTRLNDFLSRMLLLPLVMAPAMPALMWKLLVGPGFAGLAGLASRLAVPRDAWTSGPAVAAATLVVDVWVNTPWMMFLLLAGLRRLPRRRIEAARLDGVPGAFVLARITAPALAPYVFTAAALRLLESVRQLDMRYLMTLDGATDGPLVLRLPAYLAYSGTQDAGRMAGVLIVAALVTGAVVMVLVAPWRRLRQRGQADA